MKSFQNSALALFIFALVALVAPGHSYAAKDPAACGQVDKTLELKKGLFEEVEAGANSADDICGEDSDPKACVSAIKREFATAKGELKAVEAKKATACAD